MKFKEGNSGRVLRADQGLRELRASLPRFWEALLPTLAQGGSYLPGFLLYLPGRVAPGGAQTPPGRLQLPLRLLQPRSQLTLRVPKLLVL